MRARTIAAPLAAAALGLGLAGCGAGGDAEAGGQAEPITIGAVDDSTLQWQAFKDEAEKAGIPVETVNFSDFATPNDALVQGQIDLNQFQHLRFLADYNVAAGESLVPVGATVIVPASLYWEGHDSLGGIEGEDVAITNDPTNQPRAINLLVQAGLITLKDPETTWPLPIDVDEEASKVGLLPVEPAQATIAYSEGRPALIDNSFLNRAGIDPHEAIVTDDPTDPRAEPFINVFAATEETAADPVIEELASLWHTDAVREAVAEDSGGTAVVVERPREELEEILARLEDLAREQAAEQRN